MEVAARIWSSGRPIWRPGGPGGGRAARSPDRADSTTYRAPVPTVFTSERADILRNTSAFAGPCCGGLSEQAALARYPASAQCRLKEGQEWLTSLRTEQRLKTQQGWRGQVRLCGGVASDAGASSVTCYVAWHRPPIHEYFCDTRSMLVDFSASYWGPWSRKKALLPLARRGALRGRCAPSARRWGCMGLHGVALRSCALHYHQVRSAPASTAGGVAAADRGAPHLRQGPHPRPGLRAAGGAAALLPPDRAPRLPGRAQRRVQPCADTYTPAASAPYVRATRTSLLRAVRSRGTGQLVRHGTYAVRAPASGVPYVPRSVAAQVEPLPPYP